MNYRFSCIITTFCFLTSPQTVQATLMNFKNNTSHDVNILIRPLCVFLDHFSLDPKAADDSKRVNGVLHPGVTANRVMSENSSNPLGCFESAHIMLKPQTNTA